MSTHIDVETHATNVPAGADLWGCLLSPLKTVGDRSQASSRGLRTGSTRWYILTKFGKSELLR